MMPPSSRIDRARGVGDDQLGVDLHAPAESVARAAQTERTVERERLRGQLRKADAAARSFLAEGQRLAAAALVFEAHFALTLTQRDLDAFRQARLLALRQRDAVDDELDVVLELLVEGWHGVEPMHRAVDARARKAARQ